jgi:hypothetical protein
LPLSVVGGPKEGAGDEIKMGTRRLLSEGYFSNLRARSRHHRSPKVNPPAPACSKPTPCCGSSWRSARPRPGLGFRLTQALTWTPRTSACAAGGSSIKLHQLVLCGSPSSSGSFSAVPRSSRNVRVALDSGHMSDMPRGPSCANTGCWPGVTRSPRRQS